MKEVLEIDAGYNAALVALRDGGLVAVPTETVYGLAADATNADAVSKIYQAKGRPDFNPLISHVSGLDMAKHYGRFDPLALKLAEAFWPGPLTLVVEKQTGCELAPAVTANLNTVALRHPTGVMARLAHDLGAPIAAPSANTSGRVSPTHAEHVADDLGEKVDVILNGGACAVGLESTIVRISDNRGILLREGGIARADIENVIGPLLRVEKSNTIQAPGMMLAHYAPSMPVRLNVTGIAAGEALLAFGKCEFISDIAVLNLSETGKLEEAAHNLFAMMQELDKTGATGIAVVPIPTSGLGAAINDRLKRASHGARQSVNSQEQSNG